MAEELKALIRNVPDFPKKGIVFRDITTLLSEAPQFVRVVDRLAEECSKKNPQAILAVESRGFVLGGALSYRLELPFIPARKPGKLPWNTEKEDYELEYGRATLEVHTDAIKRGQRVVIVDDLLATGGTALAAAKLVEKLGGKVSGMVFLVELEFLKGRQCLKGYDLFSLVKYATE
ncbi:MAG: adenine phosphoribosyltransferase [Candidatus Eiseniibacteriota bacterium]|nr:MAG: adenine phosphoribosyltransferase [Candidatus Eisenbacteria bacterium]